MRNTGRCIGHWVNGVEKPMKTKTNQPTKHQQPIQTTTQEKNKPHLKNVGVRSRGGEKRSLERKFKRGEMIRV